MSPADILVHDVRLVVLEAGLLFLVAVIALVVVLVSVRVSVGAVAVLVVVLELLVLLFSVRIARRAKLVPDVLDLALQLLVRLFEEVLE